MDVAGTMALVVLVLATAVGALIWLRICWGRSVDWVASRHGGGGAAVPAARDGWSSARVVWVDGVDVVVVSLEGNGGVWSMCVDDPDARACGAALTEWCDRHRPVAIHGTANDRQVVLGADGRRIALRPTTDPAGSRSTRRQGREVATTGSARAWLAELADGAA